MDATPEMMERWMQEGRALRRARLKQEVAAVLRDHWLTDIGCDHVMHTDTPVCACSRVSLGTHPNVGAAVDAWVRHVVEMLA